MKKTSREFLSTLLVVMCTVVASGCISVPTDHNNRTMMGPLRFLKSNPRYFIDPAGRPVYLTGSHHWFSFQDGGKSDPPPIFDYSEYLNFMERHNHNFMRLWVKEQARWFPSEDYSDFYISPLPYKRTGPGIARDGKPKFDLDRFNPEYFDRLRDRVVAAGARGIYVSIMLFNGWGVMPFEDMGLPGNPWLGHPFHRDNNVNGIDGDVNGNDQGDEVHTLGSDPRHKTLLKRQEAYVSKVIDTVNDLDNVLYEVGNEIVEASTEWQYHIIQYVKTYEAGKPKQHPIGMTFQGMQGGAAPHNHSLWNSPADWISPGNREAPGDALTMSYRHDPPVTNHAKVIITDTDHLWGVGGDRVWVWKSFMRGLNPIYMDPYGKQDQPKADEYARRAMGDTLIFAGQVKLALMKPRPDLSSTTYCLAEENHEYLVYVPPMSEASPETQPSRTITVELPARKFHMNWFNPETGERISGDLVTSRGGNMFPVPYSGDAVLHLVSAESPTEGR